MKDTTMILKFTFGVIMPLLRPNTVSYRCFFLQMMKNIKDYSMV